MCRNRYIEQEDVSRSYVSHRQVRLQVFSLAPPPSSGCRISYHTDIMSAVASIVCRMMCPTSLCRVTTLTRRRGQTADVLWFFVRLTHTVSGSCLMAAGSISTATRKRRPCRTGRRGSLTTVCVNGRRQVFQRVARLQSLLQRLAALSSWIIVSMSCCSPGAMLSLRSFIEAQDDLLINGWHASPPTGKCREHWIPIEWRKSIDCRHRDHTLATLFLSCVTLAVSTSSCRR